LSAEHLEKINPQRFVLPVCNTVYESTSVVFHHKFLMGSKSDMEEIALACRKVIANKDELRT
ncbi:MAG: hypothetical protein PHS67_05670, partial [Sphaerochaetaceae bacterium]|nr:hypothetical protein [Sphaerochaetaceae bacterium]